MPGDFFETGEVLFKAKYYPYITCLTNEAFPAVHFFQRTLPLAQVNNSPGHGKPLRQDGQLSRHHCGLKVSEAIIMPASQKQLGPSETGLHNLAQKPLDEIGGSGDNQGE